MDTLHLFTASNISLEIQKRITGKSYIENPDISLEQLSYLKVLHYDFDHCVREGELIVHVDLEEEFLDIFRKLYEAEYEIASLRLIDDFWAGEGVATDEVSMEANNSSAFCYRKIAGSNRLSNHARGCAVDINPQQNPYIRYKNGKPLEVFENARDYVDRSQVKAHMITEEDLCYRLFTERGFIWGGHWEEPKDYQHFEKKMSK